MQNIDQELGKLILLYILREKEVVSRRDLSDFVLGKYMDYFAMEQYLNDLEQSDLVEAQDAHAAYRITPSGVSAVELFKLRIPHSIRTEIVEFAGNESVARSSTMGLDAEIQPEPDGRYAVRCTVRDYDSPLFEVILHASSAEEATDLRGRFLTKGLRLYRNWISELQANE